MLQDYSDLPQRRTILKYDNSISELKREQCMILEK